MFVLGLAYIPVMILGFIAGGGLSAPIKDPHLAIMELLILVSGPVLVIMFAAIHAYAGRSDRVLSLTAFVLVGALAGITVSVHFVLLTVGRQVNPAEMPGFSYLLSWRWPSVFFALDIVAWDLFFGLALLAAAPVFGGDRVGRWVRAGMIAAGTLCLFGLVGAVLGNMTVRDIGIAGYGVVFPVVAALVARVLTKRRATRIHSSSARHPAEWVADLAGFDDEKMTLGATTRIRVHASSKPLPAAPGLK